MPLRRRGVRADAVVAGFVVPGLRPAGRRPGPGGVTLSPPVPARAQFASAASPEPVQGATAAARCSAAAVAAAAEATAAGAAGESAAPAAAAAVRPPPPTHRRPLLRARVRAVR